MFATLRTILIGESRRAEDKVRDVYALELIDQKIRESEDGLKAAKATLASLIQRQRSEDRLVGGLDTQIKSMTARAQDALAAGNETLATEAAQAIATMENERGLRMGTLERLDQKVLRLKSSIETMHRRIIDLKQGQIAARAARQEAQMQSRLNKTLTSTPPAQEAEELIAHVLGQDDPFEQAEILSDIDAGLNPATLEDRMAAQGFGPSTKTTAADVLKRLQK